jgi:cobaltochelatase CobS
VDMANLTRTGFKAGDISCLMSPRTVLNWAENYLILDDIILSFKYSFLHKSDEEERATLAEYFQRVFAIELTS